MPYEEYEIDGEMELDTEIDGEMEAKTIINVEGVKVKTTDYWEAHSEYVPYKGEIIVYSDYYETDGNDVPALKIGDGVNTVEDLMFIDADLREELENAGAPAIVDKASGAIASFPDGAKNKKLKSLIFDIEPSQDLHGYSYPWPAGGGKNKLDTSNMSTASASGVTFTRSNDGVITVGGSATAAVYRTLASFQTESGVQYTINGCPSGGGSAKYRMTVSGFGYDTGSGYTFTGDGAAHNITLDVYSGYPTSGTTLAFKPMIRLKSVSDATFEPYSNICPISGWTQVDGGLAGKNLLPLTGTTQTLSGVTFTPQSDGTIKVNGTATANIAYTVGSFSGFLTGVTYTATGCPSGGSGSTYCVQLYRVNSADGSSGSMYEYGSGKTFELKNNLSTTSYQIYIQNGQTINNMIFKPMVVLGSTASEFAPHQGTPITIQLGQTVYGATEDALRGKMVIDRAVATITSFSSKSGATANMVYAYQGITSTVKKPSADSVVVDLLSDKFVKSNFGSTGGLYSTDKLGIAVNTNGTVYVGFGKNGVSSLADANTWVAANPIQVVYPLATPIEVDLIPVSGLTSLLGQNNIWASCGDTEVEYVADTKLYIEKLTQPTEDDMVANANIESGKYFMVGNTLYLSTAAITAGETINPGTNCTLTNLAAALNAINS